MASHVTGSRADDSSSSYIGSSRVELNDEPELLDKWANSMKQGIFGVLVRHALQI
jgi:hypothetical protein